MNIKFDVETKIIHPLREKNLARISGGNIGSGRILKLILIVLRAKGKKHRKTHFLSQKCDIF